VGDGGFLGVFGLSFGEGHRDTIGLYVCFIILNKSEKEGKNGIK
jgi:hypothetical protein